MFNSQVTGPAQAYARSQQTKINILWGKPREAGHLAVNRTSSCITLPGAFGVLNLRQLSLRDGMYKYGQACRVPGSRSPSASHQCLVVLRAACQLVKWHADHVGACAAAPHIARFLGAAAFAAVALAALRSINSRRIAGAGIALRNALAQVCPHRTRPSSCVL